VFGAQETIHALSQVMGSLPSDRVRPSRAFTITGVDFAGPIITLVNKGRGRKTNKSYIALFICFSIKAIHLEATSELTTATFIAALRRFISRRGRPRILYSDNGTNFIGANRELKEVHQFVRAKVEAGIGDVFVNENVEWKFIPPSSPHMEGLWEAGVKSCKYHLKRVMGNALFTFEELTTALSQIETCLNSRPLSSMSTDPMDLQPLTPAHFLIGKPLTSLPDVNITETRINRLNRWQMIQLSFQDFWKRWVSEYLNNLQGRNKWQTTRENLKINDLVIIKEDNIPPLKWRLGRVIELHSGSDDLVRVATIRTSGGNVKRSIYKLCKLPMSSDSDKQISCANLVGGMSCI